MEILLFIIWIIICGVACYFKGLDDGKSNKQKRNTEVMNIILEKDSYTDVNALIDAFIKDAIELYRILNVVVEETYLTKDKIKEMEGYVYQTVKRKMTKDIVDLISLFYVVESEKDIDDIIRLRIKLHLIQNAVEQNKPIDE